MIDQVDARLQTWIRAALGSDVTVAGLPGAAGAHPAAESGIGMHLLEIRDAPAPRTTERPPLSCQLRYLLTSWAPTSAEAHAMLGTLLFAALDEARNADLRLELDLTPIAPETWLALGVPLRAAFVVRVPLSLPQQADAGPRVTQLPIARFMNFSTLRGCVLGAGDLPLSGATVVLLATGRTTQTDHRGVFRLAMIPARPGTQTVEIRAKGSAQRFETRPSETISEPVVLRFQIQEG